eukprot:g13727.t1
MPHSRMARDFFAPNDEAAHWKRIFRDVEGSVALSEPMFRFFTFLAPTDHDALNFPQNDPTRDDEVIDVAATSAKDAKGGSVHVHLKLRRGLPRNPKHGQYYEGHLLPRRQKAYARPDGIQKNRDAGGFHKFGYYIGAQHFQQILPKGSSTSSMISIPTSIPAASTCNYAIDIGANVGMYSIPLALLKSDLRVVAVEPTRRSAWFLQKTVEANNLKDRVQVVGKAVTNKASPESQELFFRDIGGAHTGNTLMTREEMADPDAWEIPNPAVQDRARHYKVDSVSLNELLDNFALVDPGFQGLCLVKIDAECQDLAVLESGLQRLNELQQKPVILVELANAWCVRKLKRNILLVDEPQEPPHTEAAEDREKSKKSATTTSVVTASGGARLMQFLLSDLGYRRIESWNRYVNLANAEYQEHYPDLLVLQRDLGTGVFSEYYYSGVRWADHAEEVVGGRSSSLVLRTVSNLAAEASLVLVKLVFDIEESTFAAGDGASAFDNHVAPYVVRGVGKLLLAIVGAQFEKSTGEDADDGLGSAEGGRETRPSPLLDDDKTAFRPSVLSDWMVAILERIFDSNRCGASFRYLQTREADSCSAEIASFWRQLSSSDVEREFPRELFRESVSRAVTKALPRMQLKKIHVVEAPPENTIFTVFSLPTARSLFGYVLRFSADPKIFGKLLAHQTDARDRGFLLCESVCGLYVNAIDGCRAFDVQYDETVGDEQGKVRTCRLLRDARGFAGQGPTFLPPRKVVVNRGRGGREVAKGERDAGDDISRAGELELDIVAWPQ